MGFQYDKNTQLYFFLHIQIWNYKLNTRCTFHKPTVGAYFEHWPCAPVVVSEMLELSWQCWNIAYCNVEQPTLIHPLSNCVYSVHSFNQYVYSKLHQMIDDIKYRENIITKLPNGKWNNSPYAVKMWQWRYYIIIFNWCSHTRLNTMCRYRTADVCCNIIVVSGN